MKGTKERNKKKMRVGAHDCGQRGITLIALVITIIVMLILVAVTISMAINGGLFDYAGKAVGDTQNAINAEQELSNGKIQVDGIWYDSIDDYLAGEPSVFSYEETEKNENGLLTANATYTSGEYTAVIPKGFAIVPGLDGTTTIADGLVITDELDENGNSIGNEFVWIPVVLEGETQEEKETAFEAIRTDGYYNGSLQTMVSGVGLSEPWAYGYTGEVEEYNEMKRSVIENSGFYIGRYEAGSITARYVGTNTATEMVVKRDVYPYIYVGWGLSMTDYTSNVISQSNVDTGEGALALSKSMYADMDVGVTSTLCYGIQWDAMLEFIKDDAHDVTNSTTWGNYYNSGWTVTRASAMYASDSQFYGGADWELIEDTDGGLLNGDGVSYILTTGASDDFSAKNIFDVAGNAFEWTNENYRSKRVARSGPFGNSGAEFPASCRVNFDPNYCDRVVSFRVTLFIV